MSFQYLVAVSVFSFSLFSQAAQKANTGFLTWIPDGKRLRELPTECSTNRLEKIIRMAPSSFERSAAVTRYFTDCERFLTLMGESGITSMLQLFSTEYEYQNNPFISKISIRLKNNTVVHGVLGLKPDYTPRPLIVMQSGLTTGTNGSSSMRWPLMHLFDESPFHILVLGSSTSAEFGLSNQTLYAGGHQEGQYVYEVARWLKYYNEDLRGRISSIHLVGDSLGGHASLFATLYNDINPHADNRVFSSAMGLCPVVDLEPAINNIMKDTLAGKFLQEKIWWELKEMLGQVPIIDRLIPEGRKPSTSRMKEIVAEASLDHYGRHPLKWLAEIIRIIIPKSLDEYWRYNNFVDLAAQITTPLAIWAAHDDPAIDSRDNSLKLLDVANREGSQIQILHTATGSHCGFGLSHGWDVFTTFLRSEILANSPEFLDAYSEHKTPLENVQTDPVTVSEDKKFFSVKFQAESKSSFLRLTHQIFNPQLKNCKFVDPFMAEDDSCFELVSTRINLERLGISILKVPRSNVEAQALTRWANANLRLTDVEGNSIVYSQRKPAFVTWQEVTP
ncbi:MAG: hypothetical protein SGJ18_13630 [Pseudomonadota bacterium]|nr:hypothetical protein [Pseudomonadota bacterium]